MSNQANQRLRITFENHGRANIVELPLDAPLPEIMQKFCYLLVSNGWSEELVSELFQPEAGDDNNPFKWEIL